jgi:phosphatidylglycerol lysyltransferase
MQVRSRAATLERQLWRAGQKIALSLLALGVFGWLLQDRIKALELTRALDTLVAIAPFQWIGALAAAVVSFWAVGRYDGVVHQHLGTGVPLPEARRAGITAIAISQTLGAGVVTGALVRWRMLRGTSLWQATRLSFAVTLSFLAGWAVVTGAVLTAFATGPMLLAGQAALTVGIVAFGIGLWQPHRLRRFQVPNAMTQARLIGLTLVDTLAACLALYLLLPPDLTLPLATLFPAFLIALGLGLASGTPAGVGPFEVGLITLLPHVPETALLAGILGWRMVYFALPAVLGAAVAALGAPARARGPDPVLRPTGVTRREVLVTASARAEAGLARQGHLSIMESRLGAAWLVGRTGHALIGLLDPIGRDQPQRAALHALVRQAEAEARVSAVYKCSARTAALARAKGWQVAALAPEAVLNPQTFTLDGHHAAGLRRKLRRAEAARVTLQPGDRRGAAERAAIARLWAKARKGERGFSMGRYTEPYLDDQLIIEARIDGRLLAFATFHQGRSEWTLDLVRHAPQCPDGTMQAVVTHAILLARAAGITRVSLASAGAAPALPVWLVRWVGADETGLHRFKQMFSPRWQPLYIAAPSRMALAIAGAEIARAVRRPAPVSRLRPAHDNLAANEFANGREAWQMGA